MIPISVSEIYRISKKAIEKIIPKIINMIKNKAGSEVNLKDQTIGSFRRAMNSFKINIKENSSGFLIKTEVGLDSNFSQFDRSRGGSTINLFDIYDKSTGRTYKIRARNSKYLRFEFKNFQPRNPDLVFIRIKNGFMVNENGKWFVYVSEVNRKSFLGFGISKKEEDFAKEYAELIIPEINNLLSNKIDNMIVRKVKNVRKK